MSEMKKGTSLYILKIIKKDITNNYCLFDNLGKMDNHL